MAEMFLSCPRCERPLRVTDELAGKPVKCPACGMIFMASTSAETPRELPLARPLPEGGAAPTPAQPENTAIQEQPRLKQRDQQKARGAVIPPAIGLLVGGILGVGVNLLRVLIVKLDFYKPPMPPEQMPPPMRVFLSPEFVLGSALVFASISAVVLVGAIQMLRCRMYPLALASAVLAMVNFECGCCLIGLPFGVWALVVLLRDDVLSLFSRRSSTSP